MEKELEEIIAANERDIDEYADAVDVKIEFSKYQDEE